MKELKELVVVLGKCTGCMRCELACSYKHFGIFDPAFSAVHVVRFDHEPLDSPTFCLQCGLCIPACPNKAISRDPNTFAVVVNRTSCDGCGKCLFVCPIGAITLDPKEHKAVKCDLCGGDPECVKVCPEGAIKFVDVSEVPEYRREQYAKLQIKFAVPLVPYPRISR